MFIENLFNLIEVAKRRDRLQNNDIEQVARIIWAAIHGLAMLLVDKQIPCVTESSCRAIADQGVVRIVQRDTCLDAIDNERVIAQSDPLQ
jgi:hypothetical protein